MTQPRTQVLGGSQRVCFVMMLAKKTQPSLVRSDTHGAYRMAPVLQFSRWMSWPASKWSGTQGEDEARSASPSVTPVGKGGGGPWKGVRSGAEPGFPKECCANSLARRGVDPSGGSHCV